MARKLSSAHRKAISEGLKRHHRGGGRKRRKYSRSQQRAFKRSQTSKSGHKTWRQRQKSRKPGLWSNYWKKVKSGKIKRKSRKRR